MAYLTFSWWDYILFAITVIGSTSIGIFYGFFVKSNANKDETIYLVKDVKVFPTAMSFIASTISVMNLLSVPAEIYTHGTQFWMEIFSIPIAALLTYFYFMPVMQRLNITNGYQYLERRFNKFISNTCWCIFFIPAILLSPTCIYGTSLAFNQVSGFNIYIISAIISFVCTFYTTLGGLKAVIWADTLQFTITFFSLVLILILSTTSVGGLDVIWSKAEQGERIEFFLMNPDPTIRTTFWNVLIGHTFHWLVFLLFHPAAIQRIYSVSKCEDSKRVMILFTIGMMIVKSILCYTGLVIYSRYSNCDPFAIGDIKKIDQIVPYFVLDAARDVPGLGTLFVAGIINMSPSVLSTVLNIMTSIFYAEFLSPRLSKDTKKKWGQVIFKSITIILGVLFFSLVFLASRLESLFEVWYVIIACGTGVMLGSYLMGMFFSFANIKGVYISLIVYVPFMLFWIIKSQTYIWNGTYPSETKPFSIQGCNTTATNSTFSVKASNSEEIPWLFRISFHYYGVLGPLLFMVIGLTVSWFSREKGKSIDPDLLCPIVHKFVYKSCGSRNNQTIHLNERENQDVTSEFID